MKTAMTEFRSAVRQFEKSSSASGAKISKAEVSKALEVLQKDGKVTATDRKAAKDLLESAQLTKGAQDVLEAFVEGQGGPDSTRLKGEVRDAIAAQFNKLDRAGTLDWKPAREAIPVGQRLHTETLIPARHPDAFQFDVLIPTGALTPTAPQKDPNKVGTFYIQKSGGIAGRTQIAGPFSLKQMEPSRGGIGAQIDNGAAAGDVKVPKAMQEKIKDIFKDATDVDWKGKSALPVGPRYVRSPISKENHPDGYTYTALLAGGGNRPGTKMDPSKATSFFVERSGGFAGITQFAGPFSLKKESPRKPDGVDGPMIHPRKPDEDGSRMTKATREGIMAGWDKAREDGDISWRPEGSIPLGPAYANEDLIHQKTPKGWSYSALIPAGSLDPRGPRGDINTASKFFLQRTGGPAGKTEVSGPFSILRPDAPKPENGVTQATLAKMQKALEKAQKDGDLQWRPGKSLPMGPAYASAELGGANHPDAFHFTAMVPAGSLNPRFPPSDPNKATSFFVVRTGGIAGLTQTAGPIKLQ